MTRWATACTLVTLVGVLAGCQAPPGAAETPVPSGTTTHDTAQQRDTRPLAFVEFVDTLRDADLEWLRDEGFEIVRVFSETNAVTVRVPLDYRKNPLEENPRIERFRVQMR